MMRTAFQQFPDFENIHALWPRTVLLYSEFAREAAGAQRVSIDDELMAIVGLDLGEIMFLTYGLYSMFHRGEHPHDFDDDLLAATRDFPGMTNEKVRRYLDQYAADYEKLRETAQDERVGAEEGYEPYNYNPLAWYPIVRLPDGRYVVPVAHFLLRRTMALFFDLMEGRKKGGGAIGRAMAGRSNCTSAA